MSQLVEFYRHNNERRYVEKLFLRKLFFELEFFGMKTKMQSLNPEFSKARPFGSSERTGTGRLGVLRNEHQESSTQRREARRMNFLGKESESWKIGGQR